MSKVKSRSTKIIIKHHRYDFRKIGNAIDAVHSILLVTSQAGMVYVLLYCDECDASV